MKIKRKSSLSAPFFLLTALLYAFGHSPLCAGGEEYSPAARYALDGALCDITGKAADALLYSYADGFIDVKESNFLVDATENDRLNTRCLSLAESGDGPGGPPRADYGGCFALKLPAALLPRKGTECTLSLWYKSECIGKGTENRCREWETGAKLMAFGDSMNNIAFHMSGNGGSGGFVTCNGAVAAKADAPFCAAKWVFLCFAIKDNKIYIYIDGENSDMDDPAALPRNPINIINQGGFLGDGIFREGPHANGGWYSDVRVYDKALDNGQIRELYEIARRECAAQNGGGASKNANSGDRPFAHDKSIPLSQPFILDDVPPVSENTENPADGKSGKISGCGHYTPSKTGHPKDFDKIGPNASDTCSRRFLSDGAPAKSRVFSALAIPFPFAVIGGAWVVKRTRKRQKENGGPLPPWIK